MYSYSYYWKCYYKSWSSYGKRLPSKMADYRLLRCELKLSDPLKAGADLVCYHNLVFALLTSRWKSISMGATLSKCSLTVVRNAFLKYAGELNVDIMYNCSCFKGFSGYTTHCVARDDRQ